MESNVGAKNSTKPAAEQTYYELLGVDRHNFDPSALKRAYKRLALQWHPDKNPDDPHTAAETFKVVSEAFQVLSDDRRRAEYDRSLLQRETGADDDSRTDAQPKSGLRTRVFRFGGSSGWQFSDPWQLFESHFGTSGMSSLFGGPGRRFGGRLLGRTGLGLAEELLERRFGSRTANLHPHSNLRPDRQPESQPMTEKYLERTYHLSDGTTRTEYIKLAQPDRQQPEPQPGQQTIRVKYVYR